MGFNQTPRPAPATEPDAVWRIKLPDAGATERLAQDIARMVGAGDLLTLSGDLGAGKTTFARALIRTLANDPRLEVPSPTFTLMQMYDGLDFAIVHVDLYRIEDESELVELGWDEAGDNSLLVVEWAERAKGALGADRLDLAFGFDVAKGETFREVAITGIGVFAVRVARARAIHALMERAGWDDARRIFMQGDASTRAYERLKKPNGTTAVLMIAPARKGEPAVRYGKAYSVVARLSQTMDAFLAIGQGLIAQGFSAPNLIASDRAAGLAILEDLGEEGVVDADGPIAERYGEAVTALARLHSLALPATLPVADGVTYAIPPYDVDALMIEVELFLDWYAPHIAQLTLPASTRAVFVNFWKNAFQDLIAATPAPTWTLRDYHSPNLIWLAKRDGLRRLGLIDFQDCVLGPPAYDLTSLLQDARVTVPEALELRLLGQYATLRQQADPGFDTADFARAYAIAGAQRTTKILGIFTRLDRRDGKPHYLAHLHRIEHYLAKNLGHPALSDLRTWYQTHMPTAFAKRR